MRCIADKRLLTLVSRIDTVDHAGRIQTADEIDQDGTNHQHPQQQPADPMLDIHPILIPGKDNHDEIPLVVRIIQSRSHLRIVLEVNDILLV